MARRSGSCASIDSARVLTIDSKGRVSIPADIRRSFGMRAGSAVGIGFSLEEGYLVLLPERPEERRAFCNGLLREGGRP